MSGEWGPVIVDEIAAIRDSAAAAPAEVREALARVRERDVQRVIVAPLVGGDRFTFDDETGVRDSRPEPSTWVEVRPAASARAARLPFHYRDCLCRNGVTCIAYQAIGAESVVHDFEVSGWALDRAGRADWRTVEVGVEAGRLIAGHRLGVL